MRVKVDHQTFYEYDEPMHYAIERLYLTPRDEPGQRVISWELTGSGDIRDQLDAFGNVMSTMVVTRPTQSMVIRVRGEVECTPDTGMGAWVRSHLGRYEPPVEAFLRQTTLTTPNKDMSDFARAHLGLPSRESLLALARAIEGRIAYTPGVTHVGSSAMDAWSRGAGVCQDHAHVMIAVCRSQNIPSRYVSGYLSGEARASEATHAWVDVWIDGGWLAVDVTHACEATDRWLRLAVGVDYDAAAPVRGVRRGGGQETMRVAVSVSH